MRLGQSDATGAILVRQTIARPEVKRKSHSNVELPIIICPGFDRVMIC